MVRRILSVLVILGPIYGWSQSISVPLEEIKKDAPPAETTPPVTQKKDVEKVQVTGSHIRRIETEGASPITTLTRKDLDQAGHNSVGDVLRDTSMNSFGSTKEAAGSSAASNAEINLRGIGASNTLVLLNGQRLPSDAVTGAVDLNLIPMAAVERIEVLKDGASAVYGSDALGGVVNIITRKDFSGTEATFMQSQPEQKGGRKRDINLVNGINGKRFNMVNVVQYRDVEAIMARDRSFSKNGVNQSGSPGTIIGADGMAYADPRCPPGQVQNVPGEGTYCTFKYSDYATSLPAMQQFSVMSETHVEVSSRVKLTGRAGYTQKNTQWSYAPSPGVFTFPASRPLPGGINTGDEAEMIYRVTELGTRDHKITTNAVNFLLGTTVDVTDNWQVDVTGSQNVVENKDKGVSGYVLKKELRNAIASGSYDPLQPEGPNNRLVVSKYQPEQSTRSQLSSLDARATGEIAALPTGSLGGVLGTSFTFEKFSDNWDDKTIGKEVFGQEGSRGAGQRDVRAVYTELSVPVTRKLELQLAERYDHYSDFGDTANSKGALVYRPSKSWLLRGSVGTGFKAPLMQDLYAAQSGGYPTFIDHVACNREKQAGGPTPHCVPQQYKVTSSGNPGLKPEKSLSYSTGVVFEPNKDFSVGTDFFLTHLKNVVGIDYGDATLVESQSGNAGAGGAIAGTSVTANRDVNGNIDRTKGIVAPLQNLSAQELAGVDITSAYRFRKLKLSTDHSQMFWFKEEGFPGASLRNKIGEKSRPVWRNATALTYNPAERHDLSLTGITIAGQAKAVPEMGRLNNYTSFDLQYSYKSKKLGRITAGVRNVFGSTPPLDDSSPQEPLDERIYDQIGRQFYSSYTATF